MRSRSLIVLCGMLAGAILLAGSLQPAAAQSTDGHKTGNAETGYAAKKPVFGGSCNFCPWGSMAEIVKTAVAFYGWDVQICYVCAGGPREARLVAGAVVPPLPDPSRNLPPPPKSPVDFGATGSQYLWWAYQGSHDFAQDPEGARKQLRLVANIQDPYYFVVAVKADSGITDLHQIIEKRLPVQILASTGIDGAPNQEILDYYGLTKEKLESFGASLRTNNSPENRKNLDVIIGWAALNGTPEFNLWYEVSQKYDLKYLELPKDFREKMVKQEDVLEERNIPVGLLHGIDHPILTVTRTGIAIYGRTDMPDDFAYTLAKAMDEHQDLLQWANSNMHFSYNSHTVWKAFGVPLHPGAARYYKQKGYMK